MPKILSTTYLFIQSADIANSNTTEDDKVKAMITQSSVEYDPTK